MQAASPAVGLVTPGRGLGSCLTHFGEGEGAELERSNVLGWRPRGRAGETII